MRHQILTENSKLTDLGEFKIAKSQYEKGKAFIGAAILLKQHTDKKHFDREPHKYVYLHLIAQGVELIVKSFLLFKDYRKFEPKQAKYGHDLPKLVTNTLREFSQNPLSDTLKTELGILGGKYAKHTLRYAGLTDIFIDPVSIRSDRVLHRIAVAIRLANRAIKLSPHLQQVSEDVEKGPAL